MASEERGIGLLDKAGEAGPSDLSTLCSEIYDSNIVYKKSNSL